MMFSSFTAILAVLGLLNGRLLVEYSSAQADLSTSALSARCSFS